MTTPMRGQSDADMMKEEMLRSPIEQKVAQDDPEANYMPPEAGPFKCGVCAYFEQPNACQKVDGEIEAEGCCNLFEPSEGNEQDELSDGADATVSLANGE